MDPDTTTSSWPELAHRIEGAPDPGALGELGQSVIDYCTWRARGGFAARAVARFSPAHLAALQRCAIRILTLLESDQPVPRHDIVELVRLVLGSDESPTTITRARRVSRRSSRRIEDPSQLQFSFMR